MEPQRIYLVGIFAASMAAFVSLDDAKQAIEEAAPKTEERHRGGKSRSYALEGYWDTFGDDRWSYTVTCPDLPNFKRRWYSINAVILQPDSRLVPSGEQE